MSFVSFFKQLLLNYQKYWIWLKFLMVAKWTHVIFPLPQFSATVLLHSTWNVHLLLGSAAWFSFAVIPIENNSEDYRKATILSDWKLWAVPWVVVEFCLGAGVLQTSNSRKWTKWVGSFCWPFCLRVTCCLTTTIWPPVRNLTVLVHVFVYKFFLDNSIQTECKTNKKYWMHVLVIQCLFKLQYCVGLWTDLLESVSDGETLNRIYGFNN